MGLFFVSVLLNHPQARSSSELTRLTSTRTGEGRMTMFASSATANTFDYRVRCHPNSFAPKTPLNASIDDSPVILATSHLPGDITSRTRVTRRWSILSYSTLVCDHFRIVPIFFLPSELIFQYYHCIYMYV